MQSRAIKRLCYQTSNVSYVEAPKVLEKPHRIIYFNSIYLYKILTDRKTTLEFVRPQTLKTIYYIF